MKHSVILVTRVFADESHNVTSCSIFKCNVFKYSTLFHFNMEATVIFSVKIYVTRLLHKHKQQINNLILFI